MNYSELERAAYMAGNTALADAYAELERAERVTCSLENADIDVESMLEVKSLDRQIDDIVAERCPDYEFYREFFFDCFMRLNGHYPCPSVTSDYDKLIIFNAIEKGEE